MAEGAPTPEEARGWVGAKLDEMGGSGAGKIDAVLVDAESGEPSWLVLRAGLRRRSFVPAELAAAGVGHVWVPYGKEAIRSAPEFDPRGGLDRDAELELCEHYGIPDGAGLRTRLEDRPTGEPTSVPADVG